MSSDAVIHAEGLGKRYRLGAQVDARVTLREQINGMALAPFRRLQLVDEDLTAVRAQQGPGHVEHGDAGLGAALQGAVMGMAVQDQVCAQGIDRLCQPGRAEEGE